MAKDKVRTPVPSKKPGEANGPKTDEIKAAEQAPETAEKTNPVGEATEHQSKDPYAEGKHIANPEPDNGAANRPNNGAEEAYKAHAIPGSDAEKAAENSSDAEQDEVAEGREESDAEKPNDDEL